MIPTALPRRPNYFDGQDLGTADFLAERDHLDGLRRLYNAGLHTWGIAQGLGVVAGGDQRSVIIAPGLAIQPSGQEILLTEPTTLTTPNLGGQTVNLFIISQARRTHPSQASLASGFTRLEHVAMPFFAAAGASVDDQAVFLAAVVLTASGELSGINPGPRRPCGFEVGAVDFKGPDDEVVKASLALEVDDQVTRLSLLADAVEVSGALEIAGGLTIGEQPLQSPRAILDVQSGHANLLQLKSTAGQPLMTIDQTGRTSIGPSPPSATARLSVAGDIRLDAGRALRFEGAGALQSGSSGHAISLGGASTGGGLMVFSEVGQIDLYAGATPQSQIPTLRVAVSGNVGIGVPDPGQALVVDGSVQSLSGGFIFGNSPAQTATAPSATIQVGSIVEWWSANGALTLPAEFEICDGRAITDPLSPLHGQNTPNLVGRYIRGTSDYAEIGQTGGAATHQHQIDTTPAHTHSINHQHPDISRQTNSDQMSGDGLTTDNKCSNTDHDHSITIGLSVPSTSESQANNSTLPAFDTAGASSQPASAGLIMILRIR
ncbi:MAG: hypothetical protein GC145_14865 [Caulobacter sp.]|nr:hypothetical protein [Caulobacter sp.]